jgi:hypothetical protein
MTSLVILLIISLLIFYTTALGNKMRNLSKRIVPTHEITEVSSITCDICKKTSKHADWDKNDFYEVLETEVSMRTGFNYPESDDTEEIRFDICPKCFMEKLVPLLKELGAEPTKEEHNW